MARAGTEQPAQRRPAVVRRVLGTIGKKGPLLDLFCGASFQWGLFWTFFCTLEMSRPISGPYISKIYDSLEFPYQIEQVASEIMITRS
jgi:hypothetical protein